VDFINNVIEWFLETFFPKSKKKGQAASKKPNFPKAPYKQHEVPDLYNIPKTLALYAVKWFVSSGMSLEGAAAMAGNLWRESYLNPTQLQIIDGLPKGPGKGLAQWTDSSLTIDKKDDGKQRWDKYIKFFGEIKTTDPYWKNFNMVDEDPQFAFIIHELINDFPGVWRNLITPGSVSQKSTLILQKYEVAKDRNKKEEQNLRATLSEKIYDIAKRDTQLSNPKNLRKVS
jgi:hypothetical protein